MKWYDRLWIILLFITVGGYTGYVHYQHLYLTSTVKGLAYVVLLTNDKASAFLTNLVDTQKVKDKKVKDMLQDRLIIDQFKATKHKKETAQDNFYDQPTQSGF